MSILYPVGRIDGAGVEIEQQYDGVSLVTLTIESRGEPQVLTQIAVRALAALLLSAADECDRMNASLRGSTTRRS